MTLRSAAGVLARRAAIAGVVCAAVALAACGRLPPGPARVQTVAPGVTVAGIAVGGMDGADAERVVEGLAAGVARAPINAYVDPNTHGLVPGLDGAQLNIPATTAAVLSAARGAAVSPVVQAAPPAISVADLPAAPIYNGPPQRRDVAFVMNVAWGDQYMPGMLQTLENEKAPVTWCLVGRWAETHPDLVREIAAAGAADGAPFTFCNHGYRDHGWALLSQQQAYASITAADRAIAARTGATPRYFSPHRGEYNPAVLAASREAGRELVLRSLDTIDWKNPTPSSMRPRIVNRAKAGDIVLMHPAAPTEQALAAMIQGVRAKGLTLVTLDALLSPSGTAGQSMGNVR